MTTIEVDRLAKRFGATAAVDHLSFVVRPGTVTGFLGPNGAGKTTTLRALLGLVRPTSGTATFGGTAYRELRHPARVVGAVLEAVGAHPGHRARDHLAIVAAAAGAPRGRVEAVLDLVGLGDAGHRRVGAMSLGMRQRLALARALLCDPEVLVLDEPTNGLDPEGAHWLRGLLRRAAAEGRTVLVSSHQLAEVAQTVDDVVVIDRGRHVASAPLSELAGRAERGVRVRTPMLHAFVRALDAAGLAHVADGPDAVVVPAATTEEVGRLASAAGVVVHELGAASPALEAAFLALTGQGPLAQHEGARR
jgi:ABC-2 type transport system ATP-binding protein